MGTIDEPVKATVEALKSQPLVLALVLMNVALLGLLYYVAVRSSEMRQSELQLIFQQQKDFSVLLSRCVVPEEERKP
jgi:hypothetical protein